MLRSKITIISFVFGLIFLQNLLSYPINMIASTEFYILIENLIDPSYLLIAFLTTITSFFCLLFLYWILPTKRFTIKFHNSPFQLHSETHYVKIWYLLSGTSLFIDAILFWQSGFVLPLFSLDIFDKIDYSTQRVIFHEELSLSLAQINLYLLMTTQIFISFFCIKNHISYRLISLILVIITGSFSLARSFIPSMILIMLFIYTVYKPFYLHDIKNIINSFLFAVFVLIISFVLISYSTQESFGVSLLLLFERIIHGQWLGLPLYLSYFEGYRMTPLLLLHPYIRSIIGISDLDTPGRELMGYINPSGVITGYAGNVPTFFVGEAYAIGGWWGVCLSVLYVSLFMLIVAFIFQRMRKTYFSCCLYGWIGFKLYSGLSNGLSSFLFSGLTAVIICLLVWSFFHRENVQQ